MKVLSSKPTKVQANSANKNGSMIIILKPDCPFEPGDKVFQVAREDGSVLLLPAEKYVYVDSVKTVISKDALEEISD